MNSIKYIIASLIVLGVALMAFAFLRTNSTGQPATTGSASVAQEVPTENFYAQSNVADIIFFPTTVLFSDDRTIKRTVSSVRDSQNIVTQTFTTTLVPINDVTSEQEVYEFRKDGVYLVYRKDSVNGTSAVNKKVFPLNVTMDGNPVQIDDSSNVAGTQSVEVPKSFGNAGPGKIGPCVGYKREAAGFITAKLYCTGHGMISERVGKSMMFKDYSVPSQ
ncbi:MAG: hypothetical protein H6623_05355 [Bdellovibrionaceae bacterium]|nr:hypothetical protein [Pseudobdellovibrionaceae bacterium]